MTGQKTPTALGTEKIGKLLMQYAIPAIIAMTASSLYNMVDSIFIGHGVGAMAISGLALTFPLMNLAAAFGSLVGVGAATLVSVKLGQKDYDTAQRVLGNVLVLNMIIGLAFTVVTLLFLDPILYFFGGSDATVGYARDYMVVILLGNVVTHLYLGLNAVLRSAGHPQKASGFSQSSPDWRAYYLAIKQWLPPVIHATYDSLSEWQSLPLLRCLLFLVSLSGNLPPMLSLSLGA